MSTASDNARFDALWTTLHADSGGALDATLLPEDAQRPAHGVGATAELPRLSLRVAADASGEVLAGTGDEWVVGASLGAGGMGHVYAATQRSLGREVAIKQADASTEAHARDLLLHEARVAGRLEHPNIVPIHLLGLDAKGAPVLVMKRVEGVSLAALLRDDEHPDWPRLRARHGDRTGVVVEVLLRVCDALELAHARGVVHRDVKPDNVMIGPFGEVYLLDWGVALDAARGRGGEALVGTPAFLAPEMIDPALGAPSPATDVYLLGATLTAALTGAPPHAGVSLQNVLRAAFLAEPPRGLEGAPVELAALCRDAMVRDPASRLPTAAAFRERLIQWREHRASVVLSDGARDLLARLRALDEGAKAPGDEARELAAECRFVLTRSLAVWAGNGAARAGLQEALARTLAWELRERNLPAARATLAAMPDPGDHADAVEALARALDDERARASASAAAQREMSLSVGDATRPVLFGAMCLTMLVATFLITPPGGATPPTYAQLLPADATFAVVAAAAMFAFRRSLLANLVNRRLTEIVGLCIAGTATVDLFAWAAGWPLVVGSVYRLLVLGAITFLAALLGFPTMALPGVIALAGALAIVLDPQQVVHIVPLTLLLTTASMAWLATTKRLRLSSYDALE